MEGPTIKQVKRLLALLITPLLISSTLPIGLVSAEETVSELPLTIEVATDESLKIESTPVSVQLLPVVETFSAPMLQPSDTTAIALPPTQTPTIPIVTEPPVLPVSPLVISGYRATKNTVDFVQLYNNTDIVLQLNEWRVVLIVSHAGEESEIPVALPQGYIKPLSHIVVGWDSFAEVGDVVAPHNVPQGQELLSVELQYVNKDTYATETTVSIDPAHANNKTIWSWRDGRSTATLKYSAATKDFKLITSTDADNPKKLFGNGNYVFPGSIGLVVVEILANSRDCSPLENNIDCGDYIKLFNPTAVPIDLAGLRLRSGYQGQSSTSSNMVLLSGVVAPSGYATVWQREDGQRVNLTNTGGFIWLEDMYGMMLYENTVQEYPSAGAEKNKGQSWAYDLGDNQWKWTVPSPLSGNVFAAVITEGRGVAANDLTDCGEGRERKPETNRCRNIPIATLAACGVGQERNPETNRCRGTLSTATSLASCGAGQERNPDTNRCRAVASVSVLAACKEGQERNPETNRCRSITSTVAVSDTPYAIATTEAAKGARTGWLVVGLILLAAIGYGAYEWRREIGTFFSGLIPGKK